MNKYPIFYIDCSQYEDGKKAENIDANITTLNNIVEGWKGATPLIIFDNIRNFKCGCDGRDGVYGKICKTVFFNECNKVISVDALFTFHKDNITKNGFDEANDDADHRLGISDYLNEFSISPLNLTREKESQDFILNCLNCFFDKTDLSSLKNNATFNSEKLWQEGNGWSGNLIREMLIHLQLVTIDAYQLKKFLKVLMGFCPKRMSIHVIAFHYPIFMASGLFRVGWNIKQQRIFMNGHINTSLNQKNTNHMT